MQQIFTSELLVKHLYNETSESEATLVNAALAKDANLQKEFKQMQAAKNALDDKDGEIPGTSVIQKILAFSKEKELTEAH